MIAYHFFYILIDIFRLYQSYYSNPWGAPMPMAWPPMSTMPPQAVLPTMAAINPPKIVRLPPGTLPPLGVVPPVGMPPVAMPPYYPQMFPWNQWGYTPPPPSMQAAPDPTFTVQAATTQAFVRIAFYIRISSLSFNNLNPCIICLNEQSTPLKPSTTYSSNRYVEHARRLLMGF